MLKEIQESELNEELAHKIAILACRSFASSKTVDERIAEMLAAAADAKSEATATSRRFIVLNENQSVVAHAKTFVRWINSEIGSFPILALATVCSDPDLRGKGLGVQVTRKAFEQVGQGDWPGVSLFQTPVPKFYEKLDCKIVTNKFVDRTNLELPDAFPWRDDTVMIYPKAYDWPEGTIDINGPDY